MAPTDVQRNIIRAVVDRFLKLWEPSPRGSLIRQFEDPDALDELTRLSLLKSHDNISFSPTALSFHYCGDAEAELLAKRSVETVARVLRKQYREDKPDFTVVGLDRSVKEFYDKPDAEMVLRLGLYLMPYFHLITGWTGGNFQQLDITPTGINERVIKLKDKDIDMLWDNYINQNIPWPVQDSSGGVIPRQATFEITDEASTDVISNAFTIPSNSRKVFVVHGHDTAVRESVARLLEKLELEVVILHEQPNRGQTVIEKLERHSDVSFAVIILTPDDVGASAMDDKALKKRARQNVILELGHFMGKLGRSRVCALYVEGVELPSDFHGVLYVLYDQVGSWRLKLAKEIEAAGIPLDFNLLS